MCGGKLLNPSKSGPHSRLRPLPQPGPGRLARGAGRTPLMAGPRGRPGLAAALRPRPARSRWGAPAEEAGSRDRARGLRGCSARRNRPLVTAGPIRAAALVPVRPRHPHARREDYASQGSPRPRRGAGHHGTCSPHVGAPPPPEWFRQPPRTTFPVGRRGGPGVRWRRHLRAECLQDGGVGKEARWPRQHQQRRRPGEVSCGRGGGCGAAEAPRASREREEAGCSRPGLPATPGQGRGPR